MLFRIRPLPTSLLKLPHSGVSLLLPRAAVSCQWWAFKPGVRMQSLSGVTHIRVGGAWGFPACNVLAACSDEHLLRCRGAAGVRQSSVTVRTRTLPIFGLQIDAELSSGTNASWGPDAHDTADRPDTVSIQHLGLEGTHLPSAVSFSTHPVIQIECASS